MITFLIIMIFFYIQRIKNYDLINYIIFPKNQKNEMINDITQKYSFYYIN